METKGMAHYSTKATCAHTGSTSSPGASICVTSSKPHFSLGAASANAHVIQWEKGRRKKGRATVPYVGLGLGGLGGAPLVGAGSQVHLPSRVPEC